MKRFTLILASAAIALSAPAALAMDKSPLPPITKPGPKQPGPTFPIPDPCAPNDPNCAPIPQDPKQPIPMLKKPMISKPMILGGRKQ